LVCIQTDARHVPRENRQRVVQIVFTQNLTGAPSAGRHMRAHPVMSGRTHAGPKGISKMVEARSTSAGQGQWGIFAVGARRQPCYPLLSSLFPHRCAGMQAGGGNPQVCASLGLRSVCKTVRKFFYAIVYQCQKWFGLHELTSNNVCLFALSSSKMPRFAECLHQVSTKGNSQKKPWLITKLGMNLA